MYRGIAWRGIVPVIRKQRKSYFGICASSVRVRGLGETVESPPGGSQVLLNHSQGEGMNKIRQIIRRRRKKQMTPRLWECTEDCYHTSFRFTKGSTYMLMASDLPHDGRGNVVHFKPVDPPMRAEHGNISPSRKE